MPEITPKNGASHAQGVGRAAPFKEARRKEEEKDFSQPGQRQGDSKKEQGKQLGAAQIGLAEAQIADEVAEEPVARAGVVLVRASDVSLYRNPSLGCSRQFFWGVDKFMGL